MSMVAHDNYRDPTPHSGCEDTQSHQKFQEWYGRCLKCGEYLWKPESKTHEQWFKDNYELQFNDEEDVLVSTKPDKNDEDNVGRYYLTIEQRKHLEKYGQIIVKKNQARNLRRSD